MATESDSLITSNAEDASSTSHGSNTTEDNGCGLDIVDTIVNVVEHTQDVVVETVEAIQEVVVEKAAELQEEFRLEVEEVKEVAALNLEQADEDNLFTMDMALTRTLSILPNDIAQVAAVVQHQVQDENITAVEAIANLPDQLDGHDAASVVEDPPEPIALSDGGTPLIAFLILAMTVVGLSSVGPILDLQSGCTPLMKIVWRQNGTVLLLLPLVISDAIRSRRSGTSGTEKLTCAQWTNFGFTIFAYAAANICFVQALEYTAVGNAVIFANSQAILLLLGKLFVGQDVHFLEGVGAIVAFAGAILCSSDGAQSSSGGMRTLLGDLIALGAGIGGVSYLILAQASRKHFNLIPFMFWTMIGATALINFFQIVIGETLTFDMHPHHGFWGFLDTSRFDRFALEVINVVVW